MAIEKLNMPQLIAIINSILTIEMGCVALYVG